ncbi:MAG: hypothetical protein ABI876_14830 [Bacteroidota bacterium]
MRNHILRRYLPILIAACSLALSGCLTAEYKESIYRVRPDGSGSGVITYYNVTSSLEEGKDNSVHDYNDLVSKYIKGTKFEDNYPLLLNLKKRLVEREGKLVGEITFDFAHYEDVGLYRYQDKGPWMYFIGSTSEIAVERFDSSNGAGPTSQMPVVFWPDTTMEFRLIDRFDNAGQKSLSLLALYKKFGID